MLEQPLGQRGVARLFPQASGLKQRPDDPDIGVGGGVGIQYGPLLLALLAPQPGGKMGREIALGEVILGPG